MAPICGLDLGTTASVMAVAEPDGDLDALPLGEAGQFSVPSVAALDEDGTWRFGVAAERRALTEPEAVAREWKRRFGDETPLLVRGSPIAANDLSAMLARELVARATRHLGATPERVVVCHPANWGNYKLGLLADTLAQAGLPDHELLTEPEAAARYYAHRQGLPEGSLVAVYDLGGGTFDTALLRAGAHGSWEAVGQPAGIERLGGIDFDSALLRHVIAEAGIDADELPDDEVTRVAAGRLRATVRDAKIGLSSDTAVEIPVMLPGHHSSVRVTRSEFEDLIDQPLTRTVESLSMMVERAGLELADIDRILLVGGSSRIPLVGAKLSALCGRPVAADTHPKHAVALGAALAGLPVDRAPAQATPAPEPPPTETVPVVLPPADPPAASPAVSGPPGGPPSAAPPPPSTEPPPAPEPFPALGSAFPDLPDVASAGLPEFMTDRRPPSAPAATPPASTPPPVTPPPVTPSPAASAPAAPPPGPARSATPDHDDTGRLVRTAPAPTPVTAAPGEPPRGSVWPWLLAALVLVAAGVGAWWVLQPEDDVTAGDTTTTTADPGADTTAPPGVSTTDRSEVTAAACAAGDQPDTKLEYRIAEIDEDDPDGGLNARELPSLDAPVITVIRRFEPVTPTADCRIDDDGRTWWPVLVEGRTGWVSSRFVEVVDPLLSEIEAAYRTYAQLVNDDRQGEAYDAFYGPELRTATTREAFIAGNIDSQLSDIVVRAVVPTGDASVSARIGVVTRQPEELGPVGPDGNRLACAVWHLRYAMTETADGWQFTAVERVDPVDGCPDGDDG